MDYADERNEIWVITKDGKLWAIPISLQESEQLSDYINSSTLVGMRSTEYFDKEQNNRKCECFIYLKCLVMFFWQAN